MSRRLLNRSRPSAGRGSPSTAASASSTAGLPDYEPPSCPLNDSARRALGELSNNRGTTAAYESQLKDAARHLGTSVGDLHERLRLRHDRLAMLQKKRQEKGTEKSVEEERLEAHIPELEAEVVELGQDSERALRDVIDQRAALEDEVAVLHDVFTSAATADSGATNQRRRRPNAKHDEDDDDDDEQGEDQKMADPVPSTVDAFRNMRTQKTSTYANLSLHERYSLNNDYAGFKKLWHDAAVGEDGTPLPDASRWFRADGQPVLSRVAGSAGAPAADQDQSDDDVAVAREVLSLNCPLTLRLMEEPYSNSKCKHTFEKAAIVDYLSAQPTGQCPQTGCSQTFSLARFEQDFYLDQAILRRIQRAKQAQQSHDMDADEDEGNIDGESVVYGTQRQVRGRVPKPERS